MVQMEAIVSSPRKVSKVRKKAKTRQQYRAEGIIFLGDIGKTKPSARARRQFVVALKKTEKSLKPILDAFTRPTRPTAKDWLKPVY